MSWELLVAVGVEVAPEAPWLRWTRAEVEAWEWVVVEEWEALVSSLETLSSGDHVCIWGLADVSLSKGGGLVHHLLGGWSLSSIFDWGGYSRASRGEGENDSLELHID